VFSHPRVGTGNTRSVGGEGPPRAIAVDQSPQAHGVQCQDDDGLTLSDPPAEIDRRNGMVRVAEQSEQFVLGGVDVLGGGGRFGVEESEMRGGIGAEAEAERIGSAGASMFDGETEMVLGSSEMEVGVGPGGEVAASTQGLMGMRGGRLAGVMDEEDGEIIFPLEGAE